MKNWRKLEELIDYSALNEYIKEEYKNIYGTGYEVDVYAYINDAETAVEFYTFDNIGGNSRLDDDHFTIYRFRPSYETLDEEFESEEEYVEYMIEYYNVEIPFDEFKDEDGYIDYIDCVNYIEENFEDEYDQAVSDLIDEVWSGTITDEIIDNIREKAREEEYEEEW